MRVRRALVSVALLLPVVAVATAGGAAIGAAPADAADGLRWEVQVPGGRFHWSSAAIADVDGDGRDDVVVGGLNGRLYAFDGDGRALPGWGGGVTATSAIASSPAVGDVDGDGRPEVVVGFGALEVPNQRGGIDVFERTGARRCSAFTHDFHGANAVFNAPAIGDVNADRRNDVVFGAFDHRIRVVDGRCNLLGQFQSKDTIWSAPALHDVGGNGTAEIFIGVDASRNPATGESLDGGYFRALRWSPGYAHPDGHRNLFQYWERRSTETFQSAPAIGDVDGDGRLEAVTGSGAYWCRHFGQCADSAKVWAFHLDDGSDVPGWPRTASEMTTFLAAPALGDIDGDGRTDVVVGANSYDRSKAGSPPSGGSIDVFYGDRAKARRSYDVGDVEVVAPPVIADVNGGGTPEVLVAAAGRVTALRGDLGAVASFTGGSGWVNLKSAPAVGSPGGRWAIVSTGFDNERDGWIRVHDVATPTSLPWPMHRHDARRLGIAPLPLPGTGFHDVPDSSVYAPAVVWASDAGITTGCAPERFCPGTRVTRAQVATFLWREAGEPAPSGPQFADVRADAYYADAVRWVRDEGITTGCTETEFCPNATATRAQLVTFLWRAAGSPATDGDHGFSDVRAGAYHEDAVTWAVDQGITTGTSSTTFSPNDAVTRGQTVLFLYRYAR